MNLEARKIKSVQEFLNIQSEEIVSRLEQILRKKKKFLRIKYLNKYLKMI